MDNLAPKPFAVVTGASSRIGYELAKQFAQHGFDLLVTSTGPNINEAGDFMYIEPGMPHEVFNIGDEPLVAFGAGSTADEWDKKE